jgi:UDP-N-acetylmuramate--alanine ligase
MLCIDDPHVRAIIPLISKPVTTYGFHALAQVRAVDARAVGLLMHFTVLQEGYPATEFRLNQPGMHNVQNACSAIAIAREIGIDDSATQQGLEGFHGVGRRFTRYGEIAIPGGGSFVLVDDFGHHPVETEVTLAAARGAYPGRRLVLAFQPHRFSRTATCSKTSSRCWRPGRAAAGRRVPAGEAPIRPPTAARWRMRCRWAARSSRSSSRRSPTCRPPS